MSVWGTVLNGTVPAIGFFEEAEEKAHIKELEVTAALFGLQNFLKFANYKQVQVISGSKVTGHELTNLTSKSTQILGKLRRLRTSWQENSLTISAQHLLSFLNCWAEKLFRRNDSLSRDLDLTALRLLQRPFALKRPRIIDGNQLSSNIPNCVTPVVVPRPSLIPMLVQTFLNRRNGMSIKARLSNQPCY